jgi:hypothetical protein
VKEFRRDVVGVALAIGEDFAPLCLRVGSVEMETEDKATVGF